MTIMTRPDMAHRILTHLHTHAPADTPIRVDVRGLAQTLGCSPGTISPAIERLVQQGHLTRDTFQSGLVVRWHADPVPPTTRDAQVLTMLRDQPGGVAVTTLLADLDWQPSDLIDCLTRLIQADTPLRLAVETEETGTTDGSEAGGGTDADVAIGSATPHGRYGSGMPHPDTAIGSAAPHGWYGQSMPHPDTAIGSATPHGWYGQSMPRPDATIRSADPINADPIIPFSQKKKNNNNKNQESPPTPQSTDPFSPMRAEGIENDSLSRPDSPDQRRLPSQDVMRWHRALNPQRSIADTEWSDVADLETTYGPDWLIQIAERAQAAGRTRIVPNYYATAAEREASEQTRRPAMRPITVLDAPAPRSEAMPEASGRRMPRPDTAPRRPRTPPALDAERQAMREAIETLSGQTIGNLDLLRHAPLERLTDLRDWIARPEVRAGFGSNVLAVGLGRLKTGAPLPEPNPSSSHAAPDWHAIQQQYAAKTSGDRADDDRDDPLPFGESLADDATPDRDEPIPFGESLVEVRRHHYPADAANDPLPFGDGGSTPTPPPVRRDVSDLVAQARTMLSRSQHGFLDALRFHDDGDHVRIDCPSTPHFYQVTDLLLPGLGPIARESGWAGGIRARVMPT